MLTLARQQLAGEIANEAYVTALEELSWVGRDPYVEMALEAATLARHSVSPEGGPKAESIFDRTFSRLSEHPPQVVLTRAVVSERLKVVVGSCGLSTPGAKVDPRLRRRRASAPAAGAEAGPLRVEVHSRWLVGEDSEHVDHAGLDALHRVEVPLTGVVAPGELDALLGPPCFRFARRGGHVLGRILFESPRMLTAPEEEELRAWAAAQLSDGFGEDLRVEVAGQELHPWPVCSDS